MAYIFFFLLGIPLWLIAAARLLRSDFGSTTARWLWAATAFLLPILIFGLGAIAQAMVQQRFGDVLAWPRAFGYFMVVVNIFAFFSPFVVQLAFHARYGAKGSSAMGSSAMGR